MKSKPSWITWLSIGLLVYKISQVARADQGEDLQLSEDPAKNKATLAPYVRQQAGYYGVPERILSRLLERESGWKLDVITGRTLGQDGEVGIAQIIPRFHPAVDAENPLESIAYAAYWLADLKKKYGSWEQALAAYNWGPGNMDQYGYAARPQSTKDYISYVMA